MAVIRVLVADDESIMAAELSSMVEEAGCQVAGVAHGGQETLDLVEKLVPDLLFLDIKMPDMDGLTVAKRLADLPRPPVVVFATAYDDFALQAFAVNAVDYILKPFDERDIKRVLQKYRKLFAGTLRPGVRTSVDEPPASTARPHKFSVEKDNCGEIIDSTQMALIYAKDRRVYIRTVQGETFNSKLTLQEFEHCLDPHKFFRCHRNYIVNVDIIKKIVPWFKRGYVLVLDGGQERSGSVLEIPVSRSYVHKLRQYIQFS